jgi:hypothetical protein
MTRKEGSVKLKYGRFVKQACAGKKLYTLESEDGFVTSDSEDLEDEEGEPVQVVFFWSEKDQAEACIKNSWADYRVAELPLADFMETWCLELNNEGMLVGADFDWDQPGTEIEPLDLVLELGQELRRNRSSVSFAKYKDLVDLEKQIRQANR